MALNGKTILLVGDSHMEALGPRLVSLLSAKGARTGFVAHRGWSVERYRREGNLARTVWRHKPYDLIVIELGGNDGVAPLPSFDEHRHAIASLLEQLESSGALEPMHTRVVWLGPAVATSPRVDHDAIAEMQRRIFAHSNVRWVDSRKLTHTKDLRSDRLHFTRDGYDHWARGIASELSGSKVGTIVLLLGAAVAAFGLAHAFRTPAFGSSSDRIGELALNTMRTIRKGKGNVEVLTERGIFVIQSPRRMQGHGRRDWLITFPGKAIPEASSNRLRDAVEFIREIQ